MRRDDLDLQRLSSYAGSSLIVCTQRIEAPGKSRQPARTKPSAAELSSSPLQASAGKQRQLQRTASAPICQMLSTCRPLQSPRRPHSSIGVIAVSTNSYT